MTTLTLTAEPLSEVQSEAVDWLWQPYIPRGKLVLLDGDPRVGKSFLSIDLAARLSRGGPLPDGSPAGKPHTTLILSAEDNKKDTIRPRAEAAGADLDRVQSVRALVDAGISFPRDTEALELLVMERKADLVVLDPFLAFVPGVASNSYQGVHEPLGLLAGLAERTDCTILLIRHLRKAAMGKALYRGLGSVGIIGSVRVGLLASPLTGYEDACVLAVTKSNLSRTPATLSYRLIQDEKGMGRIEWLGPISRSADDLDAGGPKLLWPRDRAADWLVQYLANGPRPCAEVLKAAAAATIPERTLKRAKELARIQSHQVWLKSQQNVWYWYDPAAPWPKDAPFKRPKEVPEFDFYDV
jgi:AAA domain-containing protein